MCVGMCASMCVGTCVGICAAKCRMCVLCKANVPCINTQDKPQRMRACTYAHMHGHTTVQIYMSCNHCTCSHTCTQVSPAIGEVHMSLFVGSGPNQREKVHGIHAYMHACAHAHIHNCTQLRNVTCVHATDGTAACNMNTHARTDACTDVCRLCMHDCMHATHALHATHHPCTHARHTTHALHAPYAGMRTRTACRTHIHARAARNARTE